MKTPNLVTDVGATERPTKIDFKGIFNNSKKAGIRAKQKKNKLNATLRRVLAPKTAQEVLHGAGLHLDFKVEAVPGGFKAQVEWDGEVFEGTGPSKKAAKTGAADWLLAAFCVSKMPFNDENAPLNIDSLAAYAMGQLFKQWESLGYSVPNL